MKKDKLKKSILTICPFVILGCIVTIMMLYLKKYFMLEMDDDNAAEMILSWLLHRDGGIISKDWIYSTEIRVINIQIIYSFLFNFFSNWLTIRVIGNGIMYIILLGTVYYLCSQIKLKKYFIIIGIMFIIPMCRDYYVYVLHSAYMLPHLTLSMLVMAFFFHSTQLKGKRRTIILCLGGMVSFLVGMGGLRLILLLSIPLLLTSGVCWIKDKSEENRRLLISSGHFSFCSLCGYLVNVFYLSKIYDNSSVNDVRYSLFQIDNLLKVFNAYIKNYGWHYESSLFSIQTFYNIMPLCLIVTILSICYSVIKRKGIICKEHEYITIFYITGMVMLCLLYAFTYMTLYDRYLMPITCYGYFLFWIYIDTYVKENSLRNMLCVMFALYYLGYGALSLYEYTKVDTSKEIREISEFLVENQYYEGFSDCYWHEGNALMECSSGQIKVWKLMSDEFNEDAYGKDLLDNRLYWLCSKSQNECNPEGKVFIILGEKLNCLELDKLIYTNEIENIYIYGYPSYEELVLDIDK